jgi:hypothetical protein
MMKTFDVYRDYYSRVRLAEWIGFVRAETAEAARQMAEQAIASGDEQFSIEVEEAEAGAQYNLNDELA